MDRCKSDRQRAIAQAKVELEEAEAKAERTEAAVEKDMEEKDMEEKDIEEGELRVEARETREAFVVPDVELPEFVARDAASGVVREPSSGSLRGLSRAALAKVADEIVVDGIALPPLSVATAPRAPGAEVDGGVEETKGGHLTAEDLDRALADVERRKGEEKELESRVRTQLVKARRDLLLSVLSAETLEEKHEKWLLTLLQELQDRLCFYILRSASLRLLLRDPAKGMIFKDKSNADVRAMLVGIRDKPELRAMIGEVRTRAIEEVQERLDVSFVHNMITHKALDMPWFIAVTQYLAGFMKASGAPADDEEVEAEWRAGILAVVRLPEDATDAVRLGTALVELFERFDTTMGKLEATLAAFMDTLRASVPGAGGSSGGPPTPS